MHNVVPARANPLLKKASVRPEPFDTVRPELVEGTNGAQDRLVEGRTGSRAFVCSWFDRPALSVCSPFDRLRANGMVEGLTTNVFQHPAKALA
jgi:hypothetical protein